MNQSDGSSALPIRFSSIVTLNDAILFVTIARSNHSFFFMYHNISYRRYSLSSFFILWRLWTNKKHHDYDLLPPHIESKTNIRRLGYYFQRHICKLKPCRPIYRFHAYLKFPYLINSVDLCSIQEKQSQHSKRQLKTGLKRER